jgi:hypothetical protein
MLSVDYIPTMNDQLRPFESSSPIFFPVSIKKFVIMSLVTFGLYKLYWFYKNWRIYNERTGSDLWPVVRALFAFIFCYSLFKKVHKEAESNNIKVKFLPSVAAISMVFLSLCSKLPDPCWLVALISFVPLIPIQSAINDLNKTFAPDGDRNEHFSRWNIVGIIFGTIFILLAILGTIISVNK